MTFSCNLAPCFFNRRLEDAIHSCAIAPCCNTLDMREQAGGTAGLHALRQPACNTKCELICSPGETRVSTHPELERRNVPPSRTRLPHCAMELKQHILPSRWRIVDSSKVALTKLWGFLGSRQCRRIFLVRRHDSRPSRNPSFLYWFMSPAGPNRSSLI
jgi:hypothetical protein